VCIVIHSLEVKTFMGEGVMADVEERSDDDEV
jgi:hypothetical protein